MTDALTKALHRTVTEDPEVTKAAQIAAAAAAREVAAEAAAAAQAAKAAAKAAALLKLGKAPEEAPADPEEQQIEPPIQFLNEKTAEELQKEMEEKTWPVFECWGNSDPRTQRRAVSR